MVRLDEEWIQVSLAHDWLRETGDVDLVDEGMLDTENYGTLRWNRPSRFWSMLESIRQNISDPDEAASAWETLLRRRKLCRGLPESTVTNELVVVLLQPEMQMWTLSHVESLFLKQAHPDWEKWDMIESVCMVAVNGATTAELQDQVIGMVLEETFSLETLQGMQDRLEKWHVEDAHITNSALEAALVKSYWRKEEVWRAYQICYFRTCVLAEYQNALSQHDSYRIRVSKVHHVFVVYIVVIVF